MSRRVLYLLSGALVLLNALGMLFIPATFWGMFGLGVDPQVPAVGRLMTALMLANVYLFWRLKDEPRDSFGARVFSQGQVIAWGLNAVFAALAFFMLDGSPSIWVQVIISVAFAVLAGIDGFRE